MKKYTEMDYVMLNLQMMGNDKLKFGLNSNHQTEVETIEKTIEALQNRLEEVNKEEPDESKYGYRVSLEIFKKGEPTNVF